MQVVKEYKIKGGTWGYATEKKSGVVQTGWYHSPDGWTDYSDNVFVIHDGMNVVLYGSIAIGDVQRGRSAAGCSVEDMEGNEYYMSVGNIVEALRYVAEGKLHAGQGWITGSWTLKKQGDTVSLTPYWKV